MNYGLIEDEKKDNFKNLLCTISQVLLGVFLFAMVYFLMWKMNKLMMAMTQNTFMMCNMTKTLTMQKAECINI
jgi:hypothetical protein